MTTETTDTQSNTITGIELEIINQTAEEEAKGVDILKEQAKTAWENEKARQEEYLAEVVLVGETLKKRCWLSLALHFLDKSECELSKAKGFVVTDREKNIVQSLENMIELIKDRRLNSAQIILRHIANCVPNKREGYHEAMSPREFAFNNAADEVCGNISATLRVVFEMQRDNNIAEQTEVTRQIALQTEILKSRLKWPS